MGVSSICLLILIIVNVIQLNDSKFMKYLGFFPGETANYYRYCWSLR